MTWTAGDVCLAASSPPSDPALIILVDPTHSRGSDMDRRYDANDAAELRAFDAALWELMNPARSYYWYPDAEVFAAAHARIWQLVEQHGDLEQPVFLRIAPPDGRAPLVDIEQPELNASPVTIVTVEGIELIGGQPERREDPAGS